MTVVLVHGNPETDAIWDPLVEALGRDDVIRLSPPGFGAPLPDDWPATYLDYRDWLEDELTRLDAPVDLVGHDWGGNHVVNAMMHRPELVRTWASDIIGVFDPDYVWHEAALVWQTPGDGELLADAMMGGSLQDRTDRMVALGVTPEVAAKMAPAHGQEMGRALLLLYRSARHPALAEAGRSLERPRRDRGCACLRPRTTTSARTRSGAGQRRAREPAPRYSTGWATGGWCKTRHGARPH
jgi:pimeloyl-ACP methyl ester carboxylesterase